MQAQWVKEIRGKLSLFVNEYRVASIYKTDGIQEWRVSFNTTSYPSLKRAKEACLGVAKLTFPEGN